MRLRIQIFTLGLALMLAGCNSPAMPGETVQATHYDENAGKMVSDGETANQELGQSLVQNFLQAAH